MKNGATQILMVDDNPDVLRVFSEILRLDDYDVVTASTGKQGLQVVRDLRPDLVLLDVVLPDLSGIEVCRRIKTDPGLLDVFVVLFSGEATTGQRQADGLETGADEYLLKTVDLAEFRARIRTVVRLRHTTAALRASEQHYRRLVEILPDAVCLIDPQHRMAAVNQRAVAMLKHSSAETLLGSSIFDLIEEADRARLKADLRQTLKGGAVRNAEYRMLAKNGRRFPVELSAAPAMDASGQPAGLVAVARDITDRKRTEEELRHLSRRVIEAQESERIRVARELHDGINQVIASVDMRLRKVESGLAGTNPAAREILRRCSRLLVGALEDNRRIARDLHPGELDELGLAAACRSLCEEFQSRTGLDVKCDIAPMEKRLPAEVELNVFRIVQEALNNSEKHGKAKSIQLRMKVEKGALDLAIRDNGRGFNTKPGAAPRRKQGGSGLSNMRQRAASLGGTCEITSVAGKGATITVRVPAVA